MNSKETVNFGDAVKVSGVWAQDIYRECLTTMNRDWFDSNDRKELNGTIHDLLANFWRDALDRVSKLLDL